MIDEREVKGAAGAGEADMSADVAGGPGASVEPYVRLAERPT